MLEPPIDGLFTGEAPARCLIGDTGSGILEGEGGGRRIQVDDDEPVVDDEGAGLAFMKEASDVCLNLAGSWRPLADELSKFETRNEIVRKDTIIMRSNLPLKVEAWDDDVTMAGTSSVLNGVFMMLALGGASLSSRLSGLFSFIDTLRVTRRGPEGGSMAFLPFDKFAIGFESAVRECPMVAERPRFTGKGISDEVDVDGRGRREGAAEEVEDSATFSDEVSSTIS
jgi:hypothetical protein